MTVSRCLSVHDRVCGPGILVLSRVTFRRVTVAPGWEKFAHRPGEFLAILLLLTVKLPPCVENVAPSVEGAPKETVFRLLYMKVLLSTVTGVWTVLIPAPKSWRWGRW